MKLCLFILVINFSLIPTQRQNKLDLICREWRLFGIRELNKKFVSINDSLGILLFNRDGTLRLQNHMNKAKGKWQFNDDSTKLRSEYFEAIGGHPFILLSEGATWDSIIKLTKDTLVYISQQNAKWYYVSRK